MTEFHIIIPARYNSSRLPGKVLLDIKGKPMLQHVYERAVQTGAASITIATDDEQVKKVAQSFGATVCMTAVSHASGTDRVAEAAEKLGLGLGAIVVNVQADQPLIPPSTIRLVAEGLAKQSAAQMATVCAPLQRHEDLMNPNMVKVVLDKKQCALYFSRSTIPWDRDAFLNDSTGATVNLKYYYQHMGLYAYRTEFLQRYLTWDASPLENIEALEQLRVLWHGEKIYVAITDEKIPPEVNTPEDLKAVCHSGNPP
jgi:3-deoxy-manno-octulosonate cytidylyltransferase (CMP-KDO synthetase)